MGNLGIGSVMEVVKGAMNNGERFKKMKKFFLELEKVNPLVSGILMERKVGSLKI